MIRHFLKFAMTYSTTYRILLTSCCIPSTSPPRGEIADTMFTDFRSPVVMTTGVRPNGLALGADVIM
jgi:hypothetical protein